MAVIFVQWVVLEKIDSLKSNYYMKPKLNRIKIFSLLILSIFHLDCLN
jgi:hypothetical protein